MSRRVRKDDDDHSHYSCSITYCLDCPFAQLRSHTPPLCNGTASPRCGFEGDLHSRDVKKAENKDNDDHSHYSCSITYSLDCPCAQLRSHTLPLCNGTVSHQCELEGDLHSRRQEEG